MKEREIKLKTQGEKNQGQSLEWAGFPLPHSIGHKSSWLTELSKVKHFMTPKPISPTFEFILQDNLLKVSDQLLAAHPYYCKKYK